MLFRCQQPVDPCYGRVCHNGGHCVVGTDGVLTGIAYCDCEREFAGFSCEVGTFVLMLSDSCCE